MKKQKRKLTTREIVEKAREEKGLRDLANEALKWTIYSLAIVFLVIVNKYQLSLYEVALEQIPDKYIVIEEAPVYEDEFSYLKGKAKKGTIQKGAYLYSTREETKNGVSFIVGDDTDFIPMEYVEKYLK